MSLVDIVIRICSKVHIVPELNCLKDISFCNGHPIKLLESIIEKGTKSRKGCINSTTTNRYHPLDG